MMPNHLAWFMPKARDSLALPLRGRYGCNAHEQNARRRQIWHLLQDRFFSCNLEKAHLRPATAHAERNAVREGVVQHAGHCQRLRTAVTSGPAQHRPA